MLVVLAKWIRSATIFFAFLLVMRDVTLGVRDVRNGDVICAVGFYLVSFNFFAAQADVLHALGNCA